MSFLRSLKLAVYKLNPKKQCYICKQKFHRFYPMRNSHKDINDFFKSLQMVGSDQKNYGCYYCKSNDRERHLYMYFDKLDLWANVSKMAILHFAPEKHLSQKIQSHQPLNYVKGDLFPYRPDMVKLDATNLQFEDDSFDLIICNHVLEHIPNHLDALREFFRVLRPEGMAILQTPYSALLKNHFEDDAITSEAQRRFFYGQTDHVRVVSGTELRHDFQSVGFKLDIKSHNEFFLNDEHEYFGVNPKEPLLMVRKSQ
jgi:hypothetical protein